MGRHCIRYVSLLPQGRIAERTWLIKKQCVDITFADPKDVAEVNETNCFNSSDISFNNVYSMAIASTTSSATKAISQLSLLPIAFAGLIWMILL